MAYLTQSLTGLDFDAAGDWIDTIGFDMGAPALSLDFVASSNTVDSAAIIWASPDFSMQYAFIGEDLMSVVYGDESFFQYHDPVNFTAGNSSGYTFVPGLDAPGSNLFGTSITVSTGGNNDLDQYVDDVIALTQAALDNIAVYLSAATGATLDVAVTLAQQGPSTVASAGSGALYFGDVVNGVQEVVTASQIEFLTGNDPNGAGSDINVTINTDFLTSAQAFLETGANRIPGANQLDYVSVLTHEIMHGLGFFAFRDNSGDDYLFDLGNGPVPIESTYGLSVDFVGELGSLVPEYTSSNVDEVYGESVLLEYLFNDPGSDVSHFGRFDTANNSTDLRFALMNPAVVGGDVTTIGAIELAVFKDLGYTIENDANLGLLNIVGDTANLPVLATDGMVDVSGGQTGFTITRSMTGSGQLIASVGVEVSLVGGDTDVSRFRLDFNEASDTYLFSAEFLEALGEAGGGDVNLRLFYTANGVLSNGGVELASLLTFPMSMGNANNNGMLGSALSDTIAGGDGNDSMRGFADDDLLLGGQGDDFAKGDDGDDQIFGGSGDDDLRGDAGNDFVYGGDGEDRINGGNDDDNLFGGADDDTIFTGLGDDYAEGGSGNDRLFGSDGADILLGGVGDDRVQGDDGNDIVSGGEGVDRLRGDAGDDELYGDEGNDVMFGGTGVDTLFGGDDNDRIYGGDDGDFIVGEAGDDNLFGQDGDDFIYGEEGDDRLLGNDGDDELNGGEGNDRLLGIVGNDTLIGEGGNDYLKGGSGMDTMFGGDGNDLFEGGLDGDILDGGAGVDRMFGQGGDDRLDGGSGNDFLNGGNGNDVFVTQIGSGKDIIQDFEDGIDLIDAVGYSEAEINFALATSYTASVYVFLDFGNGDILQIAGIAQADLTIDDFVMDMV